MLLLQGTFKRWLDDALVQVTAADTAAWGLSMVKDILWPDGVWNEEETVYTEEEMASDRKACLERLRDAVPDSLVTILTRSSVEAGAEKMHAFFQCKLLVKNLVYTIT